MCMADVSPTAPRLLEAPGKGQGVGGAQIHIALQMRVPLVLYNPLPAQRFAETQLTIKLC